MSSNRAVCSTATIRLSISLGLCATFASWRAEAQPIKADHTTLAVESIPQAALDKARALRMSLDHASVGENILGGMEALRASSPGRYSFPNWTWHERGNPGWKEKVDEFVSWVGQHKGDYDVFMMKLCYIDESASFTYYRDKMLQLEGASSQKRFVWWTMPIMTDGDGQRDGFNQQVRAYCAAHDKALYDIAAIESHAPNGSPVHQGGQEAMYAGHSSDGGHLNEAGSNRAARAMWWLMARLAGWDPQAPQDGGTGQAGSSGYGGSAGSAVKGGSAGIGGSAGTGSAGTGGTATGGAAGQDGTGGGSDSGVGPSGAAGVGGVAAGSGGVAGTGPEPLFGSTSSANPTQDGDCSCGVAGSSGRDSAALAGLALAWLAVRRRGRPARPLTTGVRRRGAHGVTQHPDQSW
jgi:hypothetical protein